MKHLNLFAFGQTNMEDLSAVLNWVECIPSGQGSLNRIKRHSPISAIRLMPTLKALVQLGLLAGNQEHFDITQSGEYFAKSGPMLRKAILRAQLLKFDEVQRIVELLGTSTSGTLPKKMVNESFGLAAPAVVMETEIQAFIVWAESCDLFGYDKKNDEIFQIEHGLPRRRQEKSKSQSHLTLVPRAS